MESNEAMQRILKSFERYYDVKTENVTVPFVAEAVFCSHNEQYFLVKIAKVADIDSNDYVFFAREDKLTAARLEELSEIAWETGLSRVHPYSGHRNSDVTLIVLADSADDEALKKAKKLNYYKSYRFSFYGWSSFRIAVMDNSHSKVVTNRKGSDLIPLFENLV